MKDYKLGIQEVTDDITRLVGENWTHPRARVYIAARVASLEAGLKKMQSELDFEREVNKRVRETLSDNYDFLTRFLGPLLPKEATSGPLIEIKNEQTK